MGAEHEFDHEIVNSRMRAIADDLIKKYEELRHIDVGSVLFVVNHKTVPSKKRVVLAKTSRIPEKWRDLLYQLGSPSFTHMIEFYGKTTSMLDENQMIALVYQELRRIGPEGQIQSPDIHEWWQMLIGLGRHWFYPDASCPNLLDDSVDWKKLMGSDYEAPKAQD